MIRTNSWWEENKVRKTLKLLGMISMVVICATACGTQEPQEETKAVQSEQNKKCMNTVMMKIII